MRTSFRVATIAATIAVSAWFPPTTSAAGQTAAAQPQGDQPVFRGGIELVQLDVSVLDRKRQPVTGLTASDFTILDNGVPRPVRAFTTIRLAVRGSDGGPALPASVPVDVVTNQVGEQEGRLVIILMDRSIPPGQPTIAARRVATAAVEALGPHDLAALVSTSGGVPQTLTADRARLIQSINAPKRDWSTGHSKELQDVMTLPDDPLSDGRCLCGLCVLETMTRIADAVRNTPRRHKVLLFIGSSVIVQAGLRAPSADVGCDYRVMDARRKLFDSLALSHLTVHSIDPGGLVTLGPQTRAGTPGGKAGEDAPVRRLQKQQTETAELLSDQGSLHVLPDLTGGRTVVNTNTPEEKVPEILAESGTYYLVGFEPATPGDADAKRNIEVRVARIGVQVFAQRQFEVRAAAKPDAVVPRSADGRLSLDSALRGLLPMATRPLTLALAAFSGPDRARALVIVNVDVGAFAGAAETAMPLSFAVSAFDMTGRPIASSRETATVTFKPSTPNRPAEANVQTHINLTPGDYEVRVAVSDPAHGVVASVFGPVTVPRFDSAPLSLSDVMVETTSRAATSADSVATPTTRRVFGQDESVRAVVQVYQGTRRTDTIQPVSVRTSIVDAQGRSVRDQLLTVAATDFSNRRAALALDIGQLPPGEYLLSVDAALGRQKASRTLHFALGW